MNATNATKDLDVAAIVRNINVSDFVCNDHLMTTGNSHMSIFDRKLPSNPTNKEKERIFTVKRMHKKNNIGIIMQFLSKANIPEHILVSSLP